ncbi:cell wall-binding repeat-containing protein [Fictibacillus nanhaiensis]|uniref:cell wall-binding repeat-containing protein n=1 Tax=Fictibacillus nanhaiensis TaxID=742169 RepID=UPI001C981809|nr:cell wall-binding repeat-containing protein [Fictibacillus nanhaiensis]MBY6037115.1 cell wall-binding repeat-containing protein [Fictibacillus nanhaiensis]
MKKILSLILVTIFLTSQINIVHANSNHEEVLIMFDEKVNREIVTSFGGEIKHTFKHMPMVSAVVPAGKVTLIKNNPNVTFVQNNTKIQSNGQVTDWGINKLVTQRAWSSGYTGKGIKIAILDTGITQHNDLQISGGVSYKSYTKSYNDDNGHGTHMAGIIGAKNNTFGSVGVAPDALLYAVKVLDKEGKGEIDSLIKGIEWSISNKMNIINLSLSLEEQVDSPALRAVLDKAYNSGILIVGAAGNHGRSNGSGDTVEYPARYSTVIAVSATDYGDKRLTNSATGSTIEISAPGENIYSTYLNNGYAKMSGTSVASSFVSGNLALLKERYPTLSNKNIRLKLQHLTLDLGAGGKDTAFGYGLIQAPSNKGKVQRLAGKNRFEVAVNVAEKGFATDNTSNTLILANYNAFADALAASPLAYKFNAPILLTQSDRLTTETKNEIIKLNPDEVIIVGGTGSINSQVFDEVDGLVNSVRRIAGKDRFEVSYNIARELNGATTAIVANGLNFPDALAIAPYAARHKYPILLTVPNRLPNDTKDALQNMQNTIVVGGPASVSAEVYNNLPNPRRIGGKDRFEVSTNIIKELNLSTDQAYLATGLTFADALTGSVLAAKNNAPLLLTGKDRLPASVSSLVKEKKVLDFTILGGAGSVAEAIQTTLENQ